MQRGIRHRIARRKISPIHMTESNGAGTLPVAIDHESPAMPVVYAHAKGAIQEQLRTAEHLDYKARTMFAIATALVGIGVPLTLNQLTDEGISGRNWLLLGAVFPVLAYLVSAYLFRQVYALRDYYYADRPDTIAKFTFMEKEAAEGSLFTLVRNAYVENESVNESKAKQLDRLFWSVVIQTIATIAYSLFVAGVALSA